MTSVYPVVSIIVPVYNTEPYLEECLDSIVNQTYRSIEIILVNDGSTDCSPEIMASFAHRDQRITTLTQPNRGVSAARNAALSVAKGEYVLFVDSDDTIRNDTVEILCQEAISTNSDIVIGNMCFCYPDGQQSFFFKRLATLSKQHPLSGAQCFSELIEAHIFPPMVVFYFTKRTFIQKYQIFFEEGIVHEDELWCVKALVYAPKASVMNFFHYYYRLRQGSVMRSDNMEYRLYSFFRVAKSFEALAAELQEKQEFAKAAGYVYVRIFYVYYSMCQLLLEMKKDTNEYKAYFERLLVNIYPVLSQLQQRYCSSFFYNGNRIFLNA